MTGAGVRLFQWSDRSCGGEVGGKNMQTRAGAKLSPQSLARRTWQPCIRAQVVGEGRRQPAISRKHISIVAMRANGRRYLPL